MYTYRQRIEAIMSTRKVTRLNDNLTMFLESESKRLGISESSVLALALSQMKEKNNDTATND